MTREEAIKCLTLEIRIRSEAYRSYLANYGKQDLGEEDFLDALYSALDALREQDRLRDLTKKMEWIPVTERLPDGWEPVLVFRRQCKAVEIDFYRPVRHQWHNFADVTHWMPMPEPPEVEV